MLLLDVWLRVGVAGPRRFHHAIPGYADASPIFLAFAFGISIRSRYAGSTYDTVLRLINYLCIVALVG